MLRLALLGVTMSVVGACDVLAPLAEMRPLNIQVHNLTEAPAFFTVETPSGALVGGAEPQSLPAWSTGGVTFFVPVHSDWTIVGEGEAFLDDTGHAVPGGERETLLRVTDLVDTTEGECQALKIDIYPLGGAYGCLFPP